MEIPLKAIGRVASPYKQKFCTPRQAVLRHNVPSKVILEPWLPEGILTDLGDFSHIWLFSYFHKKGPSRINGKIRPPRLKGEKKGVLATRSPHRPNPVGLTLVRLLSIDFEKNELLISATDLVDGTPIFDIKPYIPAYDQADNVEVGWTGSAQETLFEVRFSKEAEQILEASSSQDYGDLLKQTLQYEVRNLVDRDSTDTKEVYKSIIGDYDVHFRYEHSNVIIEQLKRISAADKN